MIYKKGIFNNKKIYMYLMLIICLLFVYFYNQYATVDRVEYNNYAETSNIIISRYLNNPISLLTNEPLFLIINMILSLVFSTNTIVLLIVFISLFITFYSLGKLTNYNILCFLFVLVVPQIRVNYFIHLRQGLALSIYLLGLAINNKNAKNIRFLSVFIHTSTAFLFLFEFLEFIFNKYKLELHYKLVLSINILLIFMNFIPLISTLLGDRRGSEYFDGVVSKNSGIGLIIWSIIFVIYYFIVPKSNMLMISIYGIIFYLLSYNILPFSARVLENIIPIIVVTILNLDNYKDKMIMSSVLIGYGMVTSLSFLL